MGRTDEIHEAVRIGEGLEATGMLAQEPMERALETVELYAHFCRATGIDDVQAVATSAIRDADNRDEFLARAALDVRVLSTEEEACYGYLAAVNSTTLTRRRRARHRRRLDAAHARRGPRRRRDMRSWPFGAVRMTERFLAQRVLKPKHLKALREHVARRARGRPVARATAAQLTGVGGTVRNLGTAADAAARPARRSASRASRCARRCSTTWSTASPT